MPEEEKVKCKCGAEMTFLLAWDNAQGTEHCFNLYGCDPCGRVFYGSIWKDARRLWIHLDKEETEEV